MNCKYQFYQGYYRKFDPRIFEQENLKKDIAKHNEDAFKSSNLQLTDYKPGQRLLDILALKKDQFGEHLRQFKLFTTYPGLLTGTGYTHETGNVGEFKIGFYFDHTTGLPYLPGHSIKGALRQAFPRKNQPRKNEPPAIKQAKASYIVSLLPEHIRISPDKQYDWVTQLEEQIFEGKRPLDSNSKPIGKVDVFLDARISKAGEGGRILGSDAITPHGDKKWKNPVPLPFLKVLPGVEWEFSFLLDDTIIDGTPIKASDKEALFTKILLDLGVGAKTNVGYGQFKIPGSATGSAHQRKPDVVARPENPPTVQRPPQKAFDPANHTLQLGQLKKGKEVHAQVTKVTEKEVHVQLLVDGWDDILPVAYFKPIKPDIGGWCKVKIKDISGKVPKIKSISLETNFVNPINLD